MQERRKERLITQKYQLPLLEMYMSQKFKIQYSQSLQKTMEYLSTNLTKEMQDFYAENYKTVMKDQRSKLMARD